MFLPIFYAIITPMNVIQTYTRLLLCLSILLLAACSSSQVSGDSNQETISIQNKGSDTIVNLALAWAEEYQNQHTTIRLSVTGGGSGTGIAALINGTVDIANASRQIKSEEIEQAHANGIDPKEYVIARDAIAVIVNPQNPINQLTLQQVSDIYTGKINNWSELGGEDRPIVRLSRESNSGTHVYFLETVIRMGSSTNKSLFSMDTLLLPSSEGIIAEVRQNPNAIGYDGLGYITPEVKVLAISPDGILPFVFPSIETVNNHSYAISRDLFMYTIQNPPDYIIAYLNWIRDDPAQHIVLDLGFVPIKPLQRNMP